MRVGLLFQFTNNHESEQQRSSAAYLWSSHRDPEVIVECGLIFPENQLTRGHTLLVVRRQSPSLRLHRFREESSGQLRGSRRARPERDGWTEGGHLSTVNF